MECSLENLEHIMQFIYEFHDESGKGLGIFNDEADLLKCVQFAIEEFDKAKANREAEYTDKFIKDTIERVKIQ